jgi:hypothetical protein
MLQLVYAARIVEQQGKGGKTVIEIIIMKENKGYLQEVE